MLFTCLLLNKIRFKAISLLLMQILICMDCEYLMDTRDSFVKCLSQCLLIVNSHWLVFWTCAPPSLRKLTETKLITSLKLVLLNPQSTCQLESKKAKWEINQISAMSRQQAAGSSCEEGRLFNLNIGNTFEPATRISRIPETVA